jgi:plasmid maintenance system antidote protein VapI
MVSQGRRQTWLAAKLGVHKSLITHIVVGRRTVDRQTGERIAELLDVPFFVLFDLSIDESSAPVVEEAIPA